MMSLPAFLSEKMMFAILILNAAFAAPQALAQAFFSGREEVVLNRHQLEALNFGGGFSDGPLAFMSGLNKVIGSAVDCHGTVEVRTSGRFDQPQLPVFAPWSRTCLTGPVARMEKRHILCQADPACLNSTPFDNDYQLISSIVRLTPQVLVGFTHGEIHYFSNYLGQAAQKEPGFYSQIGLVISYDNGLTFHKYSGQPIISAHLSLVSARSLRANVEISGGFGLVAQNGQIRIYYSDTYDHNRLHGADVDWGKKCPSACITVAAMPFSQFRDDVLNGRIPEFKKFYNGRFSEPGRGGRFQPIVPPAAGSTEGWNAWPSVIYSRSLGKYVMAYLSGWKGISLKFSKDGINNWSGDMIAMPNHSGSPGYGVPALTYPSLYSPDDTGRTHDGDQVYLYFQRAHWDVSGYNWQNSELVRRTITLRPGQKRGYAGLMTTVEGGIGYSNGLGHYCYFSDFQSYSQFVSAFGGNPLRDYFTYSHLNPKSIQLSFAGACVY